MMGIFFFLSTEWVDCGGAHEIPGIKAPLFLCGGVVWVVVVVCMGFGVHGVLVRDVVGGGGRMGDGGEEDGLWVVCW